MERGRERINNVLRQSVRRDTRDQVQTESSFNELHRRLRAAPCLHNPRQKMDPARGVRKVHDIYPDDEDTENRSHESVDKARRPSVQGAVNYARPRPSHIPRVASQSYPAFKGKQECALKISIHEIFDEELRKGTGISHLEIVEDKLTIHPHSQSKLSQQELSDLQKATHFDKKELQQWYKGMCILHSACTTVHTGPRAHEKH